MRRLVTWLGICAVLSSGEVAAARASSDIAAPTANAVTLAELRAELTELLGQDLGDQNVSPKVDRIQWPNWPNWPNWNNWNNWRNWYNWGNWGNF